MTVTQTIREGLKAIIGTAAIRKKDDKRCTLAGPGETEWSCGCSRNRSLSIHTFAKAEAAGRERLAPSCPSGAPGVGERLPLMFSRGSEGSASHQYIHIHGGDISTHTREIPTGGYLPVQQTRQRSAGTVLPKTGTNPVRFSDARLLVLTIRKKEWTNSPQRRCTETQIIPAYEVHEG